LSYSNDVRSLVLAVDDEEVIRSLLERVFERDGRFDLEVASDGIEALEKLHTQHYSLVITDLMMPRLGGIPLLREIRKDFPELPVMVFTGYGELQDAVEALRLGAVNFLRKPFELDQIMLAVARSIELTRKIAKHRNVYGFINSMKIDLSIPPHIDVTDVAIQKLVEPLVPMQIVDEADVKNVFLPSDE